MKNKMKNNLFTRTLLFMSALFLIMGAAAIGLFYYIFSIPEPEGASIADWPQRFTDNFSVWTAFENGNLTIEETGIKRLDEYGLWIQFIDEDGNEIFSHNKPSSYPAKYTASELLAVSTGDFKNGNTCFAASLEGTGGKCSYIVGFPYNIGKVMLYYNGHRVSRLSRAAEILIRLAFGIFMLILFTYIIWLSQKLSNLTEAIQKLPLRKYVPLKEKGTFHEVYAALNKMNDELKYADRIQNETERTRKEWIANITHDLKTPLSPIKGYAEILANSSEEMPGIRQYGSIILKNVDYTEKLLNDLKLTYQLESGAMPFQPQNIRIVRFLKELIIDIINDPLFSKRNLEFHSETEELTAPIDAGLFRRAVQNIIINALIHNPPGTKITVTVFPASRDNIGISVHDNGAGVDEEERSGLFNRYYRGTNTKEKPEGSGLGLAIARQIIVLHGGDITVTSMKNEGTEFVILIPAGN